MPNNLKLPAPKIQNIPYVIPTSNMTETELNKYMNGDTMSFNI